jgi:hypothetical protein
VVVLLLLCSLIIMMLPVLIGSAPHPSHILTICLSLPGPVALLVSILTVQKDHDPLAGIDETATRFMATQRTVAFSTPSRTRQCAIILTGQIVHVKAIHQDNGVDTMMECEFGWISRRGCSSSTAMEDVQGCCCCCCCCCGYCYHGWHRSAEEDQQPDTSLHTTLALNTLFIDENEQCLYFKVNRRTMLGKHFTVSECRIDADLATAEAKPLWLNGGDVVKMLGEPTMESESRQIRLNVANPADNGSLGWISQEKEYLLNNHVREVLHKSKLNIAAVWAAAYAEGEDFRRMEDVFINIEKFRHQMEIRQDKRWHQHFPAKLRPAIYSWLASAPPTETKELQWFMDELRIAEEEQLRILPHVVGMSAANRMRTVSFHNHLACLEQLQSKQSGVDLPMNARGSTMNPYLESEPFEELNDSDEEVFRVSRVLSAASTKQAHGPGSLARVSQFAKLLHQRSAQSRSHVAATVLLGVCMYSALIACLVNYEVALEPCGGADTTAYAWLWLVGLCCLYLAPMGWVLNKIAHSSTFAAAAVVMSGASAGGILGWILQYWLSGHWVPGITAAGFVLVGACTAVLLYIALVWTPGQTDESISQASADSTFVRYHLNITNSKQKCCVLCLGLGCVATVCGCIWFAIKT